MGLMGLQRLLSVQREQLRRRRQVLARNRGIAAVNRRTDSHSQQIDDCGSQNGEALGYSCLPEDIWQHIHSLMPMRDAARAACLSHAFLRSWRCRPNLKLNWPMLCPKLHGRNFRKNIDSILRNHSGLGLKSLELNLANEGSTCPYINSWLQVALTQGIQELILTLYKKYNFPCSLLSHGVRNSIEHLKLGSCVFRPTAELGPLRSLKILHLRRVCITEDELECFLSNSLALEELDLYDCKEIIVLKIPCVLQQLCCLTVECPRLQMIESKAPNLSSIHHSGGKIKLLLGSVLQMKHLSMCRANVVFYARAELPSILPNLETLDIMTGDEEVNTPMLPTKFLSLKHLTICIREGTISPSYDYFSLVSFLDASPSLETLFLDVSQSDMEHESVFGGSLHMRQLPEHHHDRLKRVEIIGFSSAESLVELTCCIAESSVSLECLTLDTLHGCDRCCGEDSKTCRPIRKALLEEACRAVVATRRYIEDKVAPTAKLTVLEPCTRCHYSSAVDDGGW